ncbi:MAG: hypothetical protein F4Z19_17065 [Holophagales bacterium]|nr:hypothetical protein [Holophagales bacterium]
MKVVRQPKAGAVREDAPPDMRWAMFWLFWLVYVVSVLEMILSLRGLSEGLGLSIGAFAALTFLAGGLATAGWSARRDGVSFLVWVERLPDRLIQSAQLVGLSLMLAALALKWGMGIEEPYEAAFTVGIALTVLAIFCNVRPLFGGRWTWKIGARKSEDRAGGSS